MSENCKSAGQGKFGKHAQQMKSTGWLSMIYKQCHRKRVIQADKVAAFGSAGQTKETAYSLGRKFLGGEAIQQGCWHYLLANQESLGQYFHSMFHYSSQNQFLQFDLYCFHYLGQQIHYSSCLLRLLGQDYSHFDQLIQCCWWDCLGLLDYLQSLFDQFYQFDLQDCLYQSGLLDLLDQLVLLLSLRYLQYCLGLLWDWLYRLDQFHFEYYLLCLYCWTLLMPYSHWLNSWFDWNYQMWVRRYKHVWFDHKNYSQSMTLFAYCSNQSTRCIGCFDLQKVFQSDRCSCSVLISAGSAPPNQILIALQEPICQPGNSVSLTPPEEY